MKHKVETDPEHAHGHARPQKKEAPGRKTASKAKVSKVSAKTHRKTSPK